MIKIEKDYNGSSLFTADRSTSWDKDRTKSFKVSLFGLTLFKKTESLHIDFEDVDSKKLMGFKKEK
jgi:hypothetical protein